jgi:N-acetylmuramoyl-L-alanine amidase
VAAKGFRWERADRRRGPGAVAVVAVMAGVSLSILLIGGATGRPRATRFGPAAVTASPASFFGKAPPAVVAIDPGHGGTNLGASGPGRGVYEKNVTLALAERISTLLVSPSTAGPEVSIVLCRHSDTLVPIRARARCAKESGARLFLSLHANAVPADLPRGSQSGFEVFVLGPREVEDDAVLAELGQANEADAVWAAHEVRATAEQSIILARTVADHLTVALGNAARRGVKQSGAALDVLRGSGTAAALVEIGFLDHPQEGTRLATPDGREPIARALTAAIRAYLVMDSTPGVAVPDSHLADRPSPDRAPL